MGIGNIPPLEPDLEPEMNTIEKISLIRNVAAEIDRRYVLSEVKAFLTEFDIKTPKRKLSHSIPTYIRNRLRGISDDKLKRMASQLDIDEGDVKKLPKNIKKVSTQAVNKILKTDSTIPNIKNLPIDAQVFPIIQTLLNEIQKALEAEAFLSVVFLCGSTLEGILLGVAKKNAERFNKAQASPKDDGVVRHFRNWSLNDFINVAFELGMLKPDVKKFSHSVRDYRNYIHPYEQVSSGFTPDKHTAALCYSTLKAAIASVAGERE